MPELQAIRVVFVQPSVSENDRPKWMVDYRRDGMADNRAHWLDDSSPTNATCGF